MRKRSEAKARPQKSDQVRREEEAALQREYIIEVPNDPLNEMIVLAAMMVDTETCDRLLPICPSDSFYATEHRVIREGLAEMRRRKLVFDPATFMRIAPDADMRLVENLPMARPDVPVDIDFAVDTLLWDWRRAQAARGSIATFLDVFQDPRSEPDRVRSTARAIADAFEGKTGRGRFLRDGDEVVRQMMSRMRKRIGGEAYYPYGIEGLDRYEDGTIRLRPGASPGTMTLVTALSGSGKALDVDTPIATPDGWSTMGALKVGDRVFDERGEPCTVLATTPVMSNRECYTIEFSDGARITADAEHLWKTLSFRERYIIAMRGERSRFLANERRRKRKGSKVRRPSDGSTRTTRQIANSVMHGKHRNHAVRVTEPIVCPRQNLPIDPYLLGVWLGDGNSTGARITSADPEILEHFAIDGWEVIQKKNYQWSINAPVVWNRRKNQSQRTHQGSFVVALRTLGVLDNKHIPAEYLRASIDQRIALLQGLMDTDGTVSKEGSLSFDNTNPRIVEGFQELLASLGIKSKAHHRQAKLYGRVVGSSWRFSFCTDLQVFRLMRKLDRIRPSQRGVHRYRYIVAVHRVESRPVRCIQVDSPNRMYLAGREMIPTHNSTLVAHMALGLARQRRKVLFGAWEENEPTTLESLTTLSLQWSRSRVLDGKSNTIRTEGDDDWAPMTKEDQIVFEEQAHKISKWVKFFTNPFQRNARGAVAEATNDSHLDTIQEHIEESGCEVFIADLLARAMVDDRPSAEKHFLYRMLAISEETKVHTLAAHQQRAKDIEARANKTPTREGIIGSGAWLDVFWTVIAPHIPAKWKNVPDNTIEGHILKQRNGPWPIGIEFGWNPDTGQITGGRSFDVKAPADASDPVFAVKKDEKKPRYGFGRGAGKRR